MEVVVATAVVATAVVATAVAAAAVVFFQRAADFSLVSCMVKAWRYHLIVLKQEYTGWVSISRTDFGMSLCLYE